jgi:hypothetical protein
MSNRGIERLKTILPANQKAMAKAQKAGDIPNISTEMVAETPAFNSHQLEGSFRDQAGMNAEHLNLAAAHVQQGAQELRAFRSDLEQSTSQLKTLRLPDTKVNIEGLKIEIPFEMKQYAIDIDQEKYMKIMFALLGDDRILQFHRHATKSNQNNTPALWLNQAVYVETCKPYVYNISKNVEQLTSGQDTGWMQIDEAKAQLASDYLEMALGPTLRSRLNQIAQANDMPLFVVFVILVDEVLKSRGDTAIPVTATSLWESPFKGEAE